MKKILYLVLIAILVLGMMQIVIPTNFLNSAASAPPPDDGVDGAYTQYIVGDWIVTGIENYTNEIIVLSGNLSIQNAGILTFRNVTLMMNCTTSDGQYYIEVNNGGSFIITDGDNNPSTTNDNSNITDSPYDGSDNGTSTDYEYYIYIWSGATFKMNNTLVRECGYSGKTGSSGIYISTNSVTIENCTFTDCYYGIYAYSGTSHLFKNNEFYNCDTGLYIYHYGSVSNSKVQYNTAHHNKNGMMMGGDYIQINNNTVHNNSQVGMSISRMDYSDIYNNTMVYNGGTSWTHNLYIGFSSHIKVYNNLIQKLKPGSYHAVMIRDMNNLDFFNNTVTYNDDQAVRCDIGSSSDTNLRFFNNNISNNLGIGLTIYGRYYTSNYVEIFDNVFYSNSNYGIHLVKLLSYKVTNNYVKGSTGGYIDATQGGDFSNNTFITSSRSFYIRDTYGSNSDTFFETVNCTYDASTVWITQGYATLIISNFLHIRTEDKNGPLPNANVLIQSKSQPSYYFEGQSDNDGWIRYITLRNQTQKNTVSGTEYVYYDPYNITANHSGYTSYGEIEPTMNKSQTVKVFFNQDMPPVEPRDLTAVSEGTDVRLTWTESPSPDISHYLIFRNNSIGGWEEVYNSSSIPAQSKWTNWTDTNAAASPATYWYKVQAVDLVYQRSEFTDIAKCGDWAIGIEKMLTDTSIQLNGSLIVLPTGNLTFKHVALRFNNTMDVESGIIVHPGGKLSILDSDNDPLTTYDQSNITVIDTSYNFYFKVYDADISMHNSKLTYCGTDDQLVYSTWQVTSGPYVMTKGDPAMRGLYAFNSTVDITNNDFSNNFAGLLLDSVIFAEIENNTFTDNIIGVYINGGNNNSVYNNIFHYQKAFSVFLYSSDNNLVSENEFSTIAGSGKNTRYAVALYGYYCSDNKIFNNDFWNEYYGIYLYAAGASNNVSNNDLFDLNSGIYFKSTYGSIAFNNNFQRTLSSDYEVFNSGSTSISGGTSNGSSNCVWSQSSEYIDISNIHIENSTGGGLIARFSYNINVRDLFIKNIYAGLAGIGGDSFEFRNITIENATYGLYFLWGATNIKLIDSIIHQETEEAIYISESENMQVTNCTLDASSYNFNITLGSVILFNTTYNQSKIKLDKTSKIVLNWYMHVRVIDWYGNPASNVNLQIRKGLGTLIYNDFTDSNGYTKWLWLHERTQFQQSNDTSAPYFFKAISGNHSGSATLYLNQSTSIDIYMENEGPEAKNIQITPTNPTTISDLMLDYTYSDSENDPEVASKIMWYVNGVYNSNYDNYTSIDDQFTSKSETWFCEVIPHDGALYGTPMTSAPVTILNTKPEATEVKIVETSPRSDQDLNVDYSYSDIDIDPEVGSQHRWFKNTGSGWEYSNVDSLTLSSSYTKKGELWKCVVKPYDGDDYGDEIESNPVTIGNTPPTASNAKIIPADPKSNETLKVNYNFYDLDSDPESESIIKWFKNDIEQTTIEGSKQVPAELTKKGETWYYSVTPSDGDDFGDPLDSTPVVIGNTAPQVVNITINPINPSTADNLTVNYQFIDDDGNTESFETSVQWLRKREGDVSFAYTGLRVHTLSSVYTTKNEIWTCEVTPHDGFAYGETVRAEVSVKIINSKPSASDLFITPDKPKTKSDMTANYKFSDLDSDFESGTELRWYRDGQEVSELKDSATVPGTHTDKGQAWYFTVTPKDGEDFGITMKSSSVSIHNSPPKAKNVKILPNIPTGNDDLLASYTYSDEDGDNESTPELMWYENGVHQPEFDNLLKVESSAVKKGKNWHFEIRVFDGIDYSNWVSSNHPEINNTLVTAKSITPAVVTVKTVIINETESQAFQINAVDPDGDLILYYWRLDGLLVSQDYFYVFTTDYDGEYSAGKYTLSLEFREFSESELTIISWEIIVNNVNRPPTINSWDPLSKNTKVLEGKSQKFSVSATDPDLDDDLSYKWYLDGTPDPLAKGSTYAYDAGTDIGVHTITVEVNDDSGASVDYFWNVTVQEQEEGELLMGQTYDWWGLIMAIISGIVAITMFLFGFVRMRKKKGKLREYMDKIEEIIKSDKDPRDKEFELKGLKGEIKSEFSKELIVENHYIILEREVDNAIGEIRTEILEERVSMPEELKGDVKEVLEDGVVTKEEYREIMNKIRSNRGLNSLEKSKLNSMMTRWMVEGKSEHAKPRAKSRKPDIYKPKQTTSSKPPEKLQTDETKYETRKKEYQHENEDEDEIEFDELD
jgi:parallel beta-helix repeat protein